MRIALSGAVVLARLGETKARVLKHANRDANRTVVGLGDEIAIREQIDNLLAHRLAYFLVVAKPVAGAARKQLVPGRFGSESDSTRHESSSLHGPAAMRRGESLLR